MRVEYSDTNAPPDAPWNGNQIPIVTNLCINKKIFECNDTNYWRIDYVDDECQQPKSLYFDPLSNVNQTKIKVVECSINTPRPTDISLTTTSTTTDVPIIGAPIIKCGNSCVRYSLPLTVLVVILVLCF